MIEDIYMGVSSSVKTMLYQNGKVVSKRKEIV
jgi:hypothetical protein